MGTTFAPNESHEAPIMSEKYGFAPGVKARLGSLIQRVGLTHSFTVKDEGRGAVR